MRGARRPIEFLFPAILLLMSGIALANNTADPVNLPSLAVSLFGLAAVLCFWKLRVVYSVLTQIWLYAQLVIVKEVHTLPTGEDSSISMERVYLDATQYLRAEINIGLGGDAGGSSLYLGVNLLAVVGIFLFLRHMASLIGGPVAISELELGTDPAAASTLRGSVLGRIRFEKKTWLLVQLEQALKWDALTIHQLLIRPKDIAAFQSGAKKEPATLRMVKASLSARKTCNAEDLVPQPATGKVAVRGPYG